jgi:hypothetical protein
MAGSEAWRTWIELVARVAHGAESVELAAERWVVFQMQATREPSSAVAMFEAVAEAEALLREAVDNGVAFLQLTDPTGEMARAGELGAEAERIFTLVGIKAGDARFEELRRREMAANVQRIARAVHQPTTKEDSRDRRDS